MLLFSIVIHIIVGIKIKTYKLNFHKSVQVLQRSEQAKQKILFDIDNQTIADFSKTAFPVLITGLTVVYLSTIVNTMNIDSIEEFPNNLILFLHNCFLPCCAISFMLLVYYLGRMTVLKSISREIRSHIGC